MVVNTVKGCRGGNTLDWIDLQGKTDFFFSPGRVKLDSRPLRRVFETLLLAQEAQGLLPLEHRHCLAQDHPRTA